MEKFRTSKDANKQKLKHIRNTESMRAKSKDVGYESNRSNLKHESNIQALYDQRNKNKATVSISPNNSNNRMEHRKS